MVLEMTRAAREELASVVRPTAEELERRKAAAREKARESLAKSDPKTDLKPKIEIVSDDENEQLQPQLDTKAEKERARLRAARAKDRQRDENYCSNFPKPLSGAFAIILGLLELAGGKRSLEAGKGEYFTQKQIMSAGQKYCQDRTWAGRNNKAASWEEIDDCVDLGYVDARWDQATKHEVYRLQEDVGGEAEFLQLQAAKRGISVS